MLISDGNANEGTFLCSDAKSKRGCNKALDCEPYDLEIPPPPYWETSRIMLNLGIHLTGDSCRWTADSDNCNSWLSITLTGCRAAGPDWNECVGWMVGTGESDLRFGDGRTTILRVLSDGEIEAH